MKLPADVLRKQFASRLVRGTVLRFEFHGFVDPKKLGPGPKFGVVLNRPDVTDPVYLMLATSKTAAYGSKVFDAVVLRVADGSYGFWSLPTVIPFRDNPVEVLRASLEEQFLAGKLDFVGELSATDMGKVDAILKACPYIKPNLKEFLLPPTA